MREKSAIEARKDLGKVTFCSNRKELSSVWSEWVSHLSGTSRSPGGYLLKEAVGAKFRCHFRLTE